MVTRFVAFSFLAIGLTTLSFGQTTKSVENTKPASSQSTAEKKLESSKLGSIKNVHKCDSLFLAGQFTEEDIAKLKEAKIKKVITLRTEGEVSWNESLALKKAGIELIKIPFRQPESLTDEVFTKVREALADQDNPVLMHCGSANRVGGVWLPYRVLDEGVELEQAIKEAKEVGLRTEFIEAKAIEYIKREQAKRKAKSSVKPGINKGFLDPELDVDQYVKRFEIESREVYASRHRILLGCEIKEGDVVADVGAGTGLFTQLFSAQVGETGWVYAVDIAPKFLKHVYTEAAKNKRKNITGVLCAENSTNLPANSVDVVFICDTYHHFEFPAETMASIHRALKKDGHLIMIDFNRIEGQTREWLMDHVRANKETFRSEIEEVGFQLESEKKIDGFKENYFLKFTKK